VRYIDEMNFPNNQGEGKFGRQVRFRVGRQGTFQAGVR
jgi:hypothetical protein